MTEKPILFSAPMVRALLDGRKSQTRRVVKLNPLIEFDRFEAGLMFVKDSRLGIAPRKPSYIVGQRLWVRETWAVDEYYDKRKPRNIPEGVTIECLESPNGVITEGNGHRKLVDKGKWRPSIFMPRWASRITLEVTEVRVQRVQEISEVDAKLEGVDLTFPRKWSTVECLMECKRRYRAIWDNLNAKRGYGWDKNPWVWCLTFRRINQ
jgi:hypothetical protein